MRLATVDAANGRKVEATLSEDARHSAVVGKYVLIRSGDDDLFLGRIKWVALTNIVHQNPSFAPFIMKRGVVPNWSAIVDIERAEIELIRAVNQAHAFVPLRRNPPSGTPVEDVGADVIGVFHTEKEHWVALGHIPYSADSLPSTIINRHYGNYGDGGYGEARHIVIFGQNGSGKSVLAMMLVAGRIAAYPRMGVLIPDLAGDLSNPDSYARGDFQWNHDTVLAAVDVTLDRISLDNIRLTSCRLLEYKLAPTLIETLGMAVENARRLARLIVDTLYPERETVVLSELTPDNLCNVLVAQIGNCYAPASRKQREDDARHKAADPIWRRRFDREISSIRQLFDGHHNIGDLIDDVLQRGRKVIITPGSGDLDDMDKQFIWHEIVNQLGWRAKRAFDANGGLSCNAMVVLDEAQDWCPQSVEDDEDNLKKKIRDLVRHHLRTTRKFGIGWMLISQSPAGIHNEVLRQAHTKYFGRNLGVGADREHMETHLGKDGLEAYRQLELQGGFFWVGVGHDNNLGTENTYFAFHPFGGNATQAFMDGNPHIFSKPRMHW